MIRFLSGLFVILVLTSCQGIQKFEIIEKDTTFAKLAAKLSSAEKRMRKKTVAVYGFTLTGRGDDSYLKYATEKLTHELVNQGGFSVIDRSRINQVLKDQNLLPKDGIDAARAASVGKILGVEGIIVGFITVKKGEVEYIVRLIQTENALILASASEKTPLKKSDETAVSGEKDIKAEPVSALLVPGKSIYRTREPIKVEYSGMPGNPFDWLTLVRASAAEDTYKEWFYTNGKKSGSCTFKPVPPGDYEIRAYFDWPKGGYKVQQRVSVKVKQ